MEGATRASNSNSQPATQNKVVCVLWAAERDIFMRCIVSERAAARTGERETTSFVRAERLKIREKREAFISPSKQTRATRVARELWTALFFFCCCSGPSLSAYIPPHIYKTIYIQKTRAHRKSQYRIKMITKLFFVLFSLWKWRYKRRRNCFSFVLLLLLLLGFALSQVLLLEDARWGVKRRRWCCPGIVRIFASSAKHRGDNAVHYMRAPAYNTTRASEQRASERVPARVVRWKAMRKR